jgi:hypothetical protein
MKISTKEKKEYFYLNQEFIHWLIEATAISNDSAKSYGSYLQSAFQKLKAKSQISGKQEHLYFEQIKAAVQAVNEELTKDAVVTLFQYLCKNGIEEELQYAKKYIQNWRSALMQYGEFLVEWIAENTKDEIQVNIENEILFTVNNALAIEDTVTFDKSNLYKIFTLRLLSQDRFYNDIYFPISLIKKVFYKRKQKKAFDSCMNKMLDHTKIFYEDGYYLLKDISQLYFREGKVYLTHKNKDFAVYTKMADNITITAVITQQMRSIVLDHDKPMLTIMTEKIAELTVFKAITEAIKSYAAGGKIDRKVLGKISKQMFADGFTDQIELQSLERELNHICEDTALQLMDTKQNASKGASYN